MKTICFCVIILCLVPLSFIHAQDRYPRPGGYTEHGHADKKAVVNFRHLATLPDTSKRMRKAENEDEEERPIPLPVPPGGKIQHDTTHIPPPGANQAESPAPATSFIATVDNNTVIPPDVGAAVGPDYLMVTLNSAISIMTKAGATVSSVSLNNFWSTLSVTTAFDPKVLYDPYSDRWIVTSSSNAENSSSAVLVAVSQTNDPTGNWNEYSLLTDIQGKLWADYPSTGFNVNWIVINANLYSNSTGDLHGTKLWILDKSDLYADGAAAFTAVYDSTIGGTLVAATTYDSTLDTLYLMQTYNGPEGYIALYSITGAIGSEKFANVAYINTTNTWADEGPNGFDFAPQEGSTELLATNDDRMQHVVYRNGYLWCVHTVFLPVHAPTRSSIQWWEVSTKGTVIQRSRIDDTTGVRFYAFPSIGVNSENFVLIGYASFSSLQYPSGDYSYRTPCDASNTLEGDYIFVAGQSVYYKTYGGDANRWGDFTSVYVDPVDDYTLWTLQEYSTTPSGGYDRWSTWWAEVTPPTNGGTGTWTWTGTSDNNWFNPCNWDQGTLPDINSDVVIPGGTPNNPTISGYTASCNTLTIDDSNGAVLTINSSASGYINIAQ